MFVLVWLNMSLATSNVSFGALERGDLEFWSAAEKLQITAVLDSQNARVGRKGGRAIGVTMASAKKVRRQKILKIFLPECSCRTERAAVRSPV
jgi:hypothetical protein